MPSQTNLSTADIAQHFNLSSSTIRRKIRSGDIIAQSVGRDYRACWEDLWACEQGPTPRGKLRERYKLSLLSKRDLGAATGFSERTVERWIAAGLPTRNAFGSVRINPQDATDWLHRTHGFCASGLERAED
jgi:hypothetical protein